MDRWMDDGWMDGWIERMDAWMDGWNGKIQLLFFSFK